MVGKSTKTLLRNKPFRKNAVREGDPSAGVACLIEKWDQRVVQEGNAPEERD